MELILIIVVIVLLILLRTNDLFYNVQGGSPAPAPAVVDLNLKYNEEYSKIMSRSSKVKINKKYSNRDFNENNLEYYQYPYKCLDYTDILDK